MKNTQLLQWKCHVKKLKLISESLPFTKTAMVDNSKRHPKIMIATDCIKAVALPWDKFSLFTKILSQGETILTIISLITIGS